MRQEPVLMATQLGIPEHLDQLRQAHPEIEAAVFIDFRASTVLCISAYTDQPQEKLDGIVEVSAHVFGVPFGARRQFLLATPIEVLVVQVAGNGTALAVIYEPDVDIAMARRIAEDASGKMES